jgi:transposase
MEEYATTVMKTGRRTKLTPEVQSAVMEALSAGNYLETAAQYAGIGASTLYLWLDRGRAEKERLDIDTEAEPVESEQKFVEFLETVEKTRAQAEVRAVALVRKAAIDGTWQAAAWYLERSHPKKWGRSQRLEHSGPEGGPVQMTVSAEDLERKVIDLLEQQGGDVSGND